MRGIGSVRAWGVLLVGAGAGLAAGAEDLPPLTVPVLIAPGGGSPETAPSPAPEPSPGPARGGPILVVPGVTTPVRTRPRPRTGLGDSTPAPAVPGSSGDLPALIGPGGTIGPRPMGALPRSSSSTLSLETIPGSEPIVSTPAPTRANPPRATVRIERDVPPPSTPSRTPTPTPRRPSGLLGRMLTPPSFLNGRAPAEPRKPITVEPRTDPAADAALKRRIEREIQESLGDRVRSVEVRVVGREVTILARTTRFWQRRNVRRSLETLSGLSGYHATIAVDE
jgi:hypothetical protein